MKRILYTLAISAVFAAGVGVGNQYSASTVSDINQPTVLAHLNANGQNQKYKITTTSRSFFLRDSAGALVPLQVNGKRYFKPGEDSYKNVREVQENQTALIVMDPWEDGGSEFLNKQYAPIYRTKILPLVNKAIELGIPVIVLTNDPSKKYADYGSDVYPELRLLAEDGKIKILFHQNYTDDSFAKLLKDNSINTLIYSGFASNMCVIGRAMGMIPMQTHGFKLYFVPEASAAVEFKDSWETGAIHKATTKIISQWIGEIIELDELMRLASGLEKSHN